MVFVGGIRGCSSAKAPVVAHQRLFDRGRLGFERMVCLGSVSCFVWRDSCCSVWVMADLYSAKVSNSKDDEMSEPWVIDGLGFGLVCKPN
ncbi:unnamed protein product [Arabis nemorensis]|uniref:Uncharacterized protein n=1 Tax=Arabis nemorensis TaxID=586526 RepID=A0A565CIZ4_9BRAS|nr:unnamed protein product [Arabis nemorensis]